MKPLIALLLALSMTACFSSKSDNSGGSTPGGGGGPKPPVAAKGVFRPNGKTTPAMAQASIVTPAATVSTTMATARKYHTGINLLSGKVLIFGGSSDDAALNPLASAETFDPETEGFTSVGSMTQARITPCGARMPDGRVVVVGGVATPSPIVDVYDPLTETWTGLSVSNLYQTNSYWGKAALFALPGNKVLFFGGQTYLVGETFWSMQVIDLNTLATTQIAEPLAQRTKFAHVILANGKVLITGGETPTGTSADILTLDLNTLAVTKIGTMVAPRSAHSMLSYPDGQVEVYGGVANLSNPAITRLTSVEVINPTTGASAKVGDLAQSRALMESNVLQSGVSLHGGGPDKDGHVTDVQLTYEHGTNVATVTNQMVHPRVYFVSVVMNNGRVLYAGGTVDSVGNVTNTAEIFDSYSLVMIQGSTDALQMDPTTAPSLQMTLVSGGPVNWTCDLGTIDASGHYTAPLWVLGSKTNPARARITATSTTDSTVKAAYDVTLIPYEEAAP